MLSLSINAAAVAALADSYDDEVSDVRGVTALPIEMGVEILESASDRAPTDPTPVYARPYTKIGADMATSEREYFLGTRFLVGLIPSATWEEEMRADGHSERSITKCRAYVDAKAL
jgi:hypothetical protein